MLLSELAKALCDAEIDAKLYGDADVLDITFDSRNVKQGTLFTCKGEAFKEEYLLSAVESGASAYMALLDSSHYIFILVFCKLNFLT